MDLYKLLECFYFASIARKSIYQKQKHIKPLSEFTYINTGALGLDTLKFCQQVQIVLLNLLLTHVLVIVEGAVNLSISTFQVFFRYPVTFVKFFKLVVHQFLNLHLVLNEIAIFGKVSVVRFEMSIGTYLWRKSNSCFVSTYWRPCIYLLYLSIRFSYSLLMK